MLSDAHAHLSCPELRSQLPDLLQRAQGAGITAIINVATEPAELEHALSLHKTHPWIYPAGATPPQDVCEGKRADFAFYAEKARAGQLIALGETGLDYRVPNAQPALQQEFLHHYFELAQECQLPLIFHCREAFGDLIHHLDLGYRGGPFMVHCFTGTLAEAQAITARGGYISLSGIVTFKRGEELRQLIPHLPLDQILIETDSPYLAPQSKRGQQNEPAYILETLSVVALAKGTTPSNLAEITTNNLSRLIKK